MSQSHGIKCGTTDEALQEQSFQCERGALRWCQLWPLTFKTLVMHKNIYNTVTDKDK